MSGKLYISTLMVSWWGFWRFKLSSFYCLRMFEYVCKSQKQELTLKSSERGVGGQSIQLELEVITKPTVVALFVPQQ